ncbi:MAG: hypothetical protein COT84_06200 [Chlamydiae bacterium CG10_big_fil_rev_8_21_14_0_10_35_9]|nr:MAG: hypothetical protein COT84_06200 [Chlamydiae bacterium CG10_big_fil_rev_8_21_14_0_10_35_9]
MSVNNDRTIIKKALEDAYSDASRQIDFCHAVREGHSITRDQIRAAFSGWQSKVTCSGHLKFFHPITLQMGEFINHGPLKKEVIVSVCRVIQAHLNILGNDIFGYRTCNFKFEPDYNKAVDRWLNRVNS